MATTELRPGNPLLFKFRPFSDRTVFLREKISRLLAVVAETKERNSMEEDKRVRIEKEPEFCSSVSTAARHSSLSAQLTLVTLRGL